MNLLLVALICGAVGIGGLVAMIINEVRWIKGGAA